MNKQRLTVIMIIISMLFIMLTGCNKGGKASSEAKTSDPLNEKENTVIEEQIEKKEEEIKTESEEAKTESESIEEEGKNDPVRFLGKNYNDIVSELGTNHSEPESYQGSEYIRYEEASIVFFFSLNPVKDEESDIIGVGVFGEPWTVLNSLSVGMTRDELINIWGNSIEFIEGYESDEEEGFINLESYRIFISFDESGDYVWSYNIIAN